MAEGYDPYKKAKDVGSHSPGSEEAKEQGMSGDKGAQQEKIAGTPDQPSQTSNRPNSEAHQVEEQRRHFPEGQAPSEQGEGSPSPETIARHQQGIGRQSGSHAQGDRSEEEAQTGEPKSEHTRGSRQGIPGDRPGNRS